jgi:Rrf2 family protein
MKITARAEYASLAMLELALLQPGRHEQAKEIAERRGIPLKFLEQILIQLRNARLVSSVRGAAGGYLLALPAEDISLRLIVEAVEGQFSLTDGKVDDQTLAAVWNEIEEQFLDRLQNVSLQDLVNLKLRENNTLDFQI